MNLVVLSGRVTAPIEPSEIGPRARARLALSVPSDGRLRRVDVIPISLLDPGPEVFDLVPGASVSIIGRVHRRFWSGASGRESRLDVVASHLTTASAQSEES